MPLLVSVCRRGGITVGPPNIRFYAGAPLIDPMGQLLGTLCVIDTKPREFSNSDAELLQVQARQVIDQVKLLRLARDAQDYLDQIMGTYRDQYQPHRLSV